MALVGFSAFCSPFVPVAYRSSLFHNQSARAMYPTPGSILAEKEKTVKEQYKASTLAIVLMFLFCPISVFGQSEFLGTPEAAFVEAGQHQTYRLSRPENFESKESWVRENYTDYLFPNSLKFEARANREAVSFWTIQDGILDHNVLSEEDGILVLETTTKLDPVGDVAEPGITSGKVATARAASASCDTSTNRCNCVLYARCLVPSLPFGLFTYADKKGIIINAVTASPGAVAVMNISPPYGHLGVVATVTKDRYGKVTSVTLKEGNYRNCTLTTRTGTPSSMKIVGYFRPAIQFP